MANESVAKNEVTTHAYTHALHYGNRILGVQLADHYLDLADHIAPINDALNALTYAVERCLREDPDSMDAMASFPSDVLKGLTLLSSLAAAVSREVNTKTREEYRRARAASK